MKMHHCFLLVSALGVLTPQFAQDAPTGAEKPDLERRSNMFCLVRTINTLEATDFDEYGSYESWQTLLERHRRDLNGWLAKFYSQETKVHFGDMPEILGGICA